MGLSGPIIVCFFRRKVMWHLRWIKPRDGSAMMSGVMGRHVTFLLGESCQDSKIFCKTSSVALVVLRSFVSPFVLWLLLVFRSLFFSSDDFLLSPVIFGLLPFPPFIFWSGQKRCQSQLPAEEMPTSLRYDCSRKNLRAPLHVLFNDDQRSKLDCQIVTSNELAACYPFHELL